MSEKVLANLEPKIVWEIFEEITKVPRPSKKEEKIRKWVKEWAKKYNITVKKEDDVGNILLYKEASADCEDYPTLIFQAHLDMVCQKLPDIEIDFDNDPINVMIEGSNVKAKGTTLGADNGIGMAFCLASLISDDLKHGAIEVLFTVDEETGLTGAFAIKPGFFTGKYLLNVDIEELGKITISSAGRGGTDFTIPIEFENKTNYSGLKLTVTGLQGGHSGTDIDLPKLNAIKVGIDTLLDLQDEILISSISAGSAHNAIPRDFEVIFLAPTKTKQAILKKLDVWKKNTLEIAKISEKNIEIEITEIKVTVAINSENTKSILNILSEINHGPYSYSKEIFGLVQTSSNLAIIKTTEKEVQIHVNTRSSVNEELEEVRTNLKKMGEKYGAQIILDEAYPAWKPNPDSAFLKLVQAKYKEVLEKDVELEAIHASLECSLFVAVDPELQVTSIGPNIHNAHSPDEFIEIESVGILWNVIKKVIENMGSLN
ncbi:MAG: beta-Ala-His dipeptidase [Candidatus Heimdallarchaeota archaeon]